MTILISKTDPVSLGTSVAKYELPPGASGRLAPACLRDRRFGTDAIAVQWFNDLMPMTIRVTISCKL